jgi:PAS domain S-box-containing protein
MLANKGIEKTFGYQSEDVLGKKSEVLYADSSLFNYTGQKIFDKSASAIENLYITQYKNKSGDIFPGETFGTKLFDIDGQWIGNLGIIRNITERQKFVTDIEAARIKAEESDRLKSAFLQNMSHEIRTPMNAILGFSQMLDRDDLTSEKRKDFISIIVSNSNQLLSIVENILTISALETNQEAEHIEAICINDVLVDLLTIFKTKATSKNLQIYSKLNLNNDEAIIYTDKTKLTQILSNLITNALKFTNKGYIEFGYILVGNEDEQMLQFYVKDSGIGIELEMQEKIFERFVQVEIGLTREYGGTGLGLSISKAFVELLGGKFWLNSEPGVGSTFYFTIPYNMVFKNTGIIQTNRKDKPTILVAEDEAFNYLFIEEILFGQNINLIHAKDGNETITICKTNTNIDLVLMDIKMPGIDGHQAAILIKAFRPELPIIAQSAYALGHEIEKYSGIFDDYITKPINEEVFIKKILRFIKFT